VVLFSTVIIDADVNVANRALVSTKDNTTPFKLRLE